MQDGRKVSDPPHVSPVAELISVLPAHTRGAMVVDIGTLLAGNPSPQVTDLLNGHGTDAALNEHFGTIKAHSLGMDMQEKMATALVVRTIHVQDGPILVAKLKGESLAEVVNVGALTAEPVYKTHPIRFEPSSGLRATMLPKGIFVVGQSAGVKSIIDVYEGDADNAVAGAAVGPYLVDLAIGQPVAFVYGLPGLYKSIASGLTLNGSQAISVWLRFAEGTLSGEASFYTANAADFSSSYNNAAARNSQPPVTLFPAADGRIERLVVPIPPSAINKSADEIISSRHQLKVLFHIMEAKDKAAGIISGASKPWKNFFVEDDPPSIFINYEIPEEQVAAFSAAVLPRGFEMAKLRILESDDPAYFLSLNVYTTLGLVSGVRFEWSVFVKDPLKGKPRFMVIQALAAGLTVDPTVEEFYTDNEPATHIHEKGLLISEALQDHGNGMENYFSSTIKWPQDSPQTDRSSREFVAANDFIFWGGGVCDHGLYSGNMHNRDVIVIPPGDYTIEDDTLWAGYVNPVPNSVYVYRNALDILISPWWNLDADYLDLDSIRIQTLVDFKQSTYSTVVRRDIVDAFKSKDDVIATFDADNSIPSVFFNYVISAAKAADFEATLGLPSGYRLDKTKILESEDREEYYLTLNVYNINDAIEGTRAEWSVYVDDGNGREHFMILETMTEDAALDPVRLLNLPSVVEHDLNGDILSTTLVSSTIEFNATLDVRDGGEELQTLDWVEAKDFVCYRNGICDKYYFGEGSLETPLRAVNPASVAVSTSTPWSSFIGSEPCSVLLRTNKQLFAKKAWNNVKPANMPGK